MENPKCDGEGRQLSEKYYLANAGFCTQVPLNKDGSPDEYPYDFALMTECTAEGEHPHFPGGSIRKLGEKAKPRRRIENPKSL